MYDFRAAVAGIYDIEAPLGRGGMALVYLARERRLDRRVALKVLDPELAADEVYRSRFLSEARLVARLTHPNIVPIYNVDEIGGFVFFAMAYVPGETLFQRVATAGPLSPELAGRIVCDIGEALDYAHARGIIHRDVKPDNILLDAFTGRALLSDFGVAHREAITPGVLGRPAAPSGRVVGTAAFMSPEQANGEPVDGRSDIYALGVVAYYALSGQFPFDAGTDEALLAMQIDADPTPLTTFAPHVPPRITQIVHRCLAKEPWARFPDAAALVRALAEAAVAPPAPLAVRAFLVRSTHLEAPALIHAAITGVGLLPATVVAWSTPAPAVLRAIATLALVAALALPVIVALVRVRRLLAAGHRREDLVAALASRQARRREELAFVYGQGPTSFERSITWLAPVALLVAAAAVAAGSGVFAVPVPLVPLLPFIAAGGAAIALLASLVARARTEQRTDPVGERSLRFWRGPAGRALFRVAAGPHRTVVPPIVRFLDRLETPA
jgi:hypothetical protein